MKRNELHPKTVHCPSQPQAQKHPRTPQVPPSSPRMPWSEVGNIKTGPVSGEKSVAEAAEVSVSEFSQVNESIKP